MRAGVARRACARRAASSWLQPRPNALLRAVSAGIAVPVASLAAPQLAPLPLSLQARRVSSQQFGGLGIATSARVAVFKLRAQASFGARSHTLAGAAGPRTRSHSRFAAWRRLQQGSADTRTRLCGAACSRCAPQQAARALSVRSRRVFASATRAVQDGEAAPALRGSGANLGHCRSPRAPTASFRVAARSARVAPARLAHRSRRSIRAARAALEHLAPRVAAREILAARRMARGALRALAARRRPCGAGPSLGDEVSLYLARVRVSEIARRRRARSRGAACRCRSAWRDGARCARALPRAPCRGARRARVPAWFLARSVAPGRRAFRSRLLACAAEASRAASPIPRLSLAAARRESGASLRGDGA